MGLGLSIDTATRNAMSSMQMRPFYTDSCTIGEVPVDLGWNSLILYLQHWHFFILRSCPKRAL